MDKDIFDTEQDKIIAELEHDNAAMRGCIEDVITRVADYDGYREAKDLMKLIDGVVITLLSGYPERLIDFMGRDSCPLCHGKTGRADKNLWVRVCMYIKDPHWVKNWEGLTEEEKIKMRKQIKQSYSEYLKWWKSLTSEEKEKYPADEERMKEKFEFNL